jgi:hypothetical protein
LRVICVAVLLAAAACGPFGGVPDHRPSAGATRPSTPAAPARTPPGPAAVLVQLASSGTYAISLVFADAEVVGPVAAHLRTVAPPLGSAGIAMPVFSTSETRLYYLDGDGDVRYVERDGVRGAAARVPGGAHAQSAFAVSPDDRRIAVAAVDYSTSPATTRLYVEDIPDGGDHVELPFPVGANVWPVGWHGGGLVVAVGAPPAQSVAGNPYGTFAGYQVLDATTGNRLGALACNPAGALTSAGSACLAGGVPLSVEDFTGATHSLAGTPPAIVSAAESPDGARVAFCCAAGQLELWDVGDGAVTGLGPAVSPDYGWIDGTHLLISDAPAGDHPRVLDVMSGASLPVAASPGRVVARIPGAL